MEYISKKDKWIQYNSTNAIRLYAFSVHWSYEKITS